MTMKTCKDCVCNDLCTTIGFNNGFKGGEQCRHFKDKSRFVELPCKVGDTVYATYHGSLSEYKVTEIRINDFLWAELYNPEYSDQYKTISACLDFSFNKLVFCTREEAEKALKEREQK